MIIKKDRIHNVDIILLFCMLLLLVDHFSVRFYHYVYNLLFYVCIMLSVLILPTSYLLQCFFLELWGVLYN